MQLNRVGQSVATLLAMSIIVFLVARLGGDPVYTMLPDTATDADRVALAERLGLDRPILEQYWIWVKSFATGDLGQSMMTPYPVSKLLFEFGPNTLLLAGLGMLFALLVGVPLGILAALRRGRLADAITRSFAVIMQSAPVFWLALMLLYFFAIRWHLFPIISANSLAGAFLPAVSLSFFMTAGVLRLTRSAMIEALDSDYVLFARVKGLPEWTVVLKHALRNALVPVVTFSGLYFAIIMSGVVVIEVVFSWPGIGLLTYRAALGGDYPVIQGAVVAITASVILVNLIVDILYALLDPRVRISAGRR